MCDRDPAFALEHRGLQTWLAAFNRLAAKEAEPQRPQESHAFAMMTWHCEEIQLLSFLLQQVLPVKSIPLPLHAERIVSADGLIGSLPFPIITQNPMSGEFPSYLSAGCRWSWNAIVGFDSPYTLHAIQIVYMMVGMTFDVLKRSSEETSVAELEELEAEAGRACEGLICVIRKTRKGDDLSQDAKDGVKIFGIFGWTAQALVRLRIHDLTNPARLPPPARRSIIEAVERVNSRRDL